MIKDFPQKKTIFIRQDQLLDDIQTQVGIVADMRPMPDGNPNPALANATTRYASQITRWIDKYMNFAKSRMAAYVVTMERKASMNAQREWDEAIIHLAFPPSWNATTFTNLADAVHQYIVNGVLYELFVLAFTSKDPLTADKIEIMEEASREIKHCCVTQKPGMARKSLHPF